MTEPLGRYDFGLRAADEQRAATLHERSVIVDLHFRGPCDRGQAGLRNGWEQSGVTAGNRFVGVDPASFAPAQRQLDELPWLVPARTAEDVRAAKRDGLRAGYLSTQFATGLTDLDALHRLGLRMIGLSYDVANEFAGGCAEPDGIGLTARGRELVRRMDDRGVLIDVSHSSRAATFDAAMLATRPIVASHTCAAALRPAARAKPDDQLRAIASTDGVIGIFAVPDLLGPGSSVETVLDHVDHVAALVGSRYVALGTGWGLPGFDDPRDFPDLTRGLVARGYADDEIRGILGENALRVFAAVWG